MHLPRTGGKHTMYSMLDWSNCPEVERVDGKVSGAWVFKGTRVPVKAFSRTSEPGQPLISFSRGFPA